MAKKKRPLAPEPANTLFLTGEGLPRMQHAKVEHVPVGVEPAPEVAQKMKHSAAHAAERATKFPAGGSAFATWCAAQGLSSTEVRTFDEWDDLLEEFAQRPIHGHRRGKAGGSHLPNREHLSD